MLIDEPEAFLHPTLARRLGDSLARLAQERDTTLFAATHSPAFLMGCINSGAPVNVIRLTFDPTSGAATARELSAASIESLMVDPLLRSTRALDGLFHRAVVVTESDADRAFYDEINLRLQSAGRGASDCMFANAQNWQTIERIIDPLRRLGIPAVGIMDFDVLLQTGPEWGRVLDSFGLSESEIDQIQNELSRTRNQLTGIDRADLKREGIGAVPDGSRGEVSSLLERLAEFGLFVVPIGELECWLSHLGVEGKKKHWVVRMFQRLGNDPADADYVTPADDDVWDFLDSIAAWIDNPGRAGIPEARAITQAECSGSDEGRF
jgi:hypothetical protein